MSRAVPRGTPVPPLGVRRPRLLIGLLSLCGTITALQQTILLPLLSELPRLLDTTPANASWLITATLLSGAAATPVITRLADMYGKRRMILVCLAFVVAGSLIGALVVSLPAALIARALQGAAVSIVPVGIAVLRDELPPDRVPIGIATMGATLAIGAGAGLPLAGIIVEQLGWRSIFWISGALGLVLLWPVHRLLSPARGRTSSRFDLRGAVLLAGALVGLLLALSKGGSWGWTAAPTVVSGGVGLLLLLAWIPLELRTRDPLIDLRVASRPRVVLVNLCSMLIGIGMFSNALVTTQLLRLPTGIGFGLGLVETGLWSIPSAVVFGAMAPVAATVSRRFGAAATLVAGTTVMAAAYVGRIFLSHELWQVALGAGLVATGTSLAFAAMPALILSAVPSNRAAEATGLNTLLRSVGTSTASAAAAAVFTAHLIPLGGTLVPGRQALVTVLALAATVSAMAALLALPLFRVGAARPDPADEGTPARPYSAVVEG